LAAARMVVRVLSVVVMPALAMLTVCCSITCVQHSNMQQQGLSRGRLGGHQLGRTAACRVQGAANISLGAQQLQEWRLCLAASTSLQNACHTLALPAPLTLVFSIMAPEPVWAVGVKDI
jgi:hypothetical protein